MRDGYGNSGSYEEYDDPDKVRRYRRASAGRGINHLLENTYGPLFLDVARSARSGVSADSLRILEFGCGAAMALHHLTESLGRQNVDVGLAVGTDFVPRMIAAADADLEEYGSDWAKQRIRHVVAPNEDLVGGIAGALGEPREAVAGSFSLAIGVNTFRYAIRNGSDGRVVEQLRELLAPGGRVIMIDMNDRFPYWLKPSRNGRPPLPSLSEYAEPFRAGGFEVLEAGSFCWIPHSSNGMRFQLMRSAGSVLDRLAPSRSMRSFVIAARP
jgi:SAM-dependent methyltransferase